MPKYKDTVALEACPAKTAETVSYAATFGVLGWLLLSNYSEFGIDYAEQTIASANPLLVESIEPATSPLLETAASYLDLGASEPPSWMAIQESPKTEQHGLEATPPSWYAELDHYQAYESHTHQREFSTAAWNAHGGNADQHISGFIKDLVISLPPIDSAYSFDEAFEILSDGDLASNAPTENGLIRGITVKGAESDRTATRPDNIHRPQIPRPYRAQEIQRSFILPPRIQALRP